MEMGSGFVGVKGTDSCLFILTHEAAVLRDSALRIAVSLRFTSCVFMESPKGQLGGWFKNPMVDTSPLILKENFNKNYQLPFERAYRRA